MNVGLWLPTLVIIIAQVTQAATVRVMRRGSETEIVLKKCYISYALRNPQGTSIGTHRRDSGLLTHDLDGTSIEVPWNNIEHVEIRDETMQGTLPADIHLRDGIVRSTMLVQGELGGDSDLGAKIRVDLANAKTLFVSTATARIRGVLRESNEPLAGEKLVLAVPAEKSPYFTIASTLIEFSVKTDTSGVFSFAGLPAGRYQILLLRERRGGAHIIAKDLVFSPDYVQASPVTDEKGGRWFRVEEDELLDLGTIGVR